MSENGNVCIPCGIRSFSRNIYFNGKPLLERDFNAEQAYMVGKDWLHNNLLHGTGTVCGLKVSPHPNESCRDRFVYIEPGVALDCCGRELIVPERKLVRVLDLIAESEIDLSGEEAQDLFIALCYAETAEEPIPVLLPTCDCAGGEQGYGRLRETVSVKLFARPAGQQLPAYPPRDPRLEWLHTLTFEEQSPRALAIDDNLGQIYVAAQGVSDPSDGARLYVFDTLTHNIITAAGAAREPTDIALSLLGDRVYVAAAQWGDEAPFGIAAFQEAQLRDTPDPAAVIDLDEPARLVVSRQTGALFALLLQSGRLWSWSDEAIRNWLDEADPPPAGPAGRREIDLSTDLTGGADESAAERGASILSITADGRYLFIADPNNGLRVVDVATFGEVTPAGIEGFGTPAALQTSGDSDYLYVLWDGEGDAAGSALLSRYRLDDDGGSLILVREGRGGQWPGTPLDLALAPAERFAYVLQEDGILSQVVVLSVDAIAATAPDEPVDPRAAREDLLGVTRHQRLNLYGRRLYVAADVPAEDEDDTARGVVAVLDVDESACADIFHGLIDGCPTCTTGGDEDHCVVLAHLPAYTLGAPIEAAGSAGAGDNVIDNLTHRPLVPSSNTIVDVIRCLLEQGFAEGVPGPRGPAGEEGAQGERGPGVTEAQAQTLTPGSAATATLEAIAGDPEGDQRLVIGIPTGETGPRGPGIVEALANTLPPGSAATATLQPIAGDPEGDQRLVLGIPRGAPGETPEQPGLTHIDALSWQHDGQMTMDEFQNLIFDPNWREIGAPRTETGLVISFDRPVRPETIFQRLGEERTRSEVFQLYVRHTDERTGLLCECILPRAIYQAVEVVNQDGDGRIVEVAPLPPDEPETRAVRLVLDPEFFPPLFDTNFLFLRVLLRADFVLDVEDLAVDGNFLGGRLPTGNGSAGDSFESWFAAGQELQ